MAGGKKQCGCACHIPKNIQHGGLMHDRVCCDNLVGTLEWREVKKLIAQEKEDSWAEGYDAGLTHPDPLKEIKTRKDLGD